MVGLVAPEWFKVGCGNEATAWLPLVSEWGVSVTGGGKTGSTGNPGRKKTKKTISTPSPAVADLSFLTRYPVCLSVSS